MAKYEKKMRMDNDCHTFGDFSNQFIMTNYANSGINHQIQQISLLESKSRQQLIGLENSFPLGSWYGSIMRLTCDLHPVTCDLKNRTAVAVEFKKVLRIG